MKKQLFAVLLLATTLANTVIVNSGSKSTVLTSPSGRQIEIDAYHSNAHSNYLGNGAQWIWVKRDVTCSPNDNTGTFETRFYADCPQEYVYITVAADDQFVAYLNGVQIGSGNSCLKKHEFKVKIQCGLNNLTISVIDADRSSPGGLIFSVHQDQTKCYGCRESPSAFYNRNTCSCQCSNECGCNTELYHWLGYPFCGCKCNKQILVPCNATTSYWSEKTCNCECNKKWCPKGYVQDRSSCACVCQPQDCPHGTAWNQEKCACDKDSFCQKAQPCNSPQTWNVAACKCTCPYQAKCTLGYFWDQATCKCQPTKPNNCESESQSKSSDSKCGSDKWNKNRCEGDSDKKKGCIIKKPSNDCKEEKSSQKSSGKNCLHNLLDISKWRGILGKKC